MALPHDQLEALIKSFSGRGVDEKSIISILGKSNPVQRQSFRVACPDLFVKDELRRFERWDDRHVKLLKHEFMRFKNAVVLWAMHPWERDARLVKEALRKGPVAYGLIVEVACTRSSDQLLGARKAYHSIFDHSIEEDVASHVHGHERKVLGMQLLVALVSAYRYEGPKVKDDVVKEEAKLLVHAIKNIEHKGLMDEEVVRILSTRSKTHLKEIYAHYRAITGKNIDQDLEENSILQAVVQCLCTPYKYFCKVLHKAMSKDAHKSTKKALTQIIVSQADADLKEISEEYKKMFGVSLSEKIEEVTNGNYRDLLLTLVAKAK